MSLDSVRLIILVLVASAVSSLGDVQGFVHAARMWQESGVDWDELGKSALGFGVSMVFYWLSTKHLIEFGVFAPEAQVLVWLSITIVGVAVLSREFLAWPILDQFVAALVCIGIAWLLYRTAA